MNLKSFVIYYEKKLLIVLNGDMQLLSSNDVLNWYAAKYAFERDKLSGYFVDTIEIEKGTF